MRTRIFKAGLLIPALALLGETKAAFAAGVVGNGTPASCTEAAFTNALAGGGTVTFNCGGAYTLVLTSPKTISADTTVEGGYKMTLSGGGKTNLFQVTTSGRLILAGITLDEGFTMQDGGAIVNHGGLILNTVTISNSSSGGGAWAQNHYRGGAIFSDGVSNVITNSKFIGNVAGDGGALYVASPGAVVQVTGGSFEDNFAQENGGAVYVVADRKFTLKDTAFTGNSAQMGGAIATEPGTTVALTGTPPASPADSRALLFELNLAISTGGAISNGGGLSIDQAQFEYNGILQTSPAGYGGAISNFGSLTLAHSEMLQNSAAFGGALSISCGPSGASSTDIEGTVFEDNDAFSMGGGVQIDDGYGNSPKVLISGSSFDGNNAGYGGGVNRRNNAALTIQKSSFTNNVGTQGGGGIALSSSGTSPYVMVQSVTFNANSGPGAAVYNAGAGLELYSDTIVGNGKTAVYTVSGNTRFRDTVLANPINCAGPKQSMSDDLANFATDLSCYLPSSQGNGHDPLLSPPKQDPNGVTVFMRPTASSPLIDKGVSCPATDQIGVPPFGASCDIGASEYQGILLGNGGVSN